jgi:dephospho-CoA kinase
MSEVSRTQRGAGQSREVLQQIGEELISTSLESFTQAVISRVPWQQGCVVDGVRHMEVLVAIKQIVSPLPVFLVFIDVPEAVRKQRLRDRGMTDQEIDSADHHEIEAQVRTVISEQADLHVDGQWEIQLTVNQIRQFLKNAPNKPLSFEQRLIIWVTSGKRSADNASRHHLPKCRPERGRSQQDV